MSVVFYGLGVCALLAANVVLYELVKIERQAGRHPSLLFLNTPRFPGQLTRFVMFGVLLVICACALVTGRQLQ